MKISTNNTFGSSFVYIGNVCREKIGWCFSILLSFLWSPRLTKIYLIKDNNIIVGGFTLTDMPTIMFHPRKIFSRTFQKQIQNIRKNRQYLSHLLIFEKYRGKWFGSQAMDYLWQRGEEKIWLVSEKTAVWFYHKMKLYEVDSRYHIFLIN